MLIITRKEPLDQKIEAHIVKSFIDVGVFHLLFNLNGCLYTGSDIHLLQTLLLRRFIILLRSRIGHILIEIYTIICGISGYLLLNFT